MEKEASQLGKGSDSEAKKEARRKSYLGEAAEAETKQNIPRGSTFLQSHPSQPETVPELSEDED